MPHKIAVITVVYQNYGVLNDLFLSLEKQTSKDFHIFISDLSDDKKTISDDDLLITVINAKNLGYAYGVNTALKEAIKHGFDKFCVINSDVLVSNNFVETVNQALFKSSNTIIGGKIYYAPGYEYHKERYEEDDLGKIIWYGGGTIDWDNVYVKHRGVDEVDQKQYDDPEETDFITGCLMAFDRSVIDQVGFWNEKYFLYYEDADFCERAKRKGIKLYYDPNIIIWHKNAQSTEGAGSALHQKYQGLSRLRFGLKYAPFNTKLHLIKNAAFNFLK
jgi:GT2 family glycosyltransferase